MIIYGKNPVKEALKSDKPIDKLVLEKDSKDGSLKSFISLAKEKGIFYTFAPKESITRLAGTDKHQGVALSLTEFDYSSLDDIINFAKEKNQSLIVVILDEITDPHNMGAIIRSAECFGAHGVIIQKHRSAQVNGTVIKASAGACAHIPICRMTNINDAIRELKERGVFVFATDFDGEKIDRANLKGDIAIVIGSEGNGIRRLTKELCDGVVTIPQSGKVSSLNASVAAGVALYEIVRQRS
ncbi:MAG: 23S rRNA (guanosine(2251)-2'-O)-methyltransferase RlmB [Clostridiales bacterium]|nr:23S rRNA (guanosine(2251)-2'-O)-methyltransferase RlmB [Clostridiales bacterium]